MLEPDVVAADVGGTQSTHLVHDLRKDYKYFVQVCLPRADRKRHVHLDFAKSFSGLCCVQDQEFRMTHSGD